MGKRGPPPRPQETKKAEGTYRADRDPALRAGGAVVGAPPGEPPCPPELGDEARRIWNDVVPALLEQGTLSKVDWGVVAGYCMTLALALSEQLVGVSTATASLESIVLDEGFGTLDTATLDMVAATLENLAARGDRMVGVVTHVPALAERIPVRYEVRKDARSARVERVGL